MGNSIILHTHLGLGDMFICNGLVRKFVAENDYDQYYVVCKRYYMHSVEPMYSDDDRISDSTNLSTIKLDLPLKISIVQLKLVGILMLKNAVIQNWCLMMKNIFLSTTSLL
jgi:hypothetical protein